MKILVIMKRFGANKDMVLENFGRQIRLFEPLAKEHKIDFFCPDYTKKESKVINRSGIRYIVKPASLFSFMPLYNSLKKLVKNRKYDIIVASTDPLIGILGYHLSKKHKIKFIYDLQDNFETYDSYKFPFVGYFDKKAVKNADIALTVSESLKKYVSVCRKKPICVIQNGIDLRLFKKIDKKTARKKLNLPLKAKIIVYIGEISKSKGAHIMLDAFKKIRKEFPHTYLLLSGKVKNGIKIKMPNIIFEELPERQDVVTALNASDIALIPNLENSFSKYCFPYKALEYMAVDLPIVSTSIGDMKILLPEKSLCKPNDSHELYKKIVAALKSREKVSYKGIIEDLSWNKLSKRLDDILKMMQNH
ncbi:glycosyltransferase family 4 protein [Candidatus Woesearchaeota archaeon]|nr:glycosyltransferase family 4 protein [Candidatus Woesearchaeota archaeon]